MSDAIDRLNERVKQSRAARELKVTDGRPRQTNADAGSVGAVPKPDSQAPAAPARKD